MRHSRHAWPASPVNGERSNRFRTRLTPMSHCGTGGGGALTIDFVTRDAETAPARSGSPVEDTRAHDSPAPRYAFGPFLVDPVRRTILRDGRLVPITSKTFVDLLVLLEYHDHTVEKDQLLSLVWPGTIVHENNLPRQVSSMRRALGQRPDRHD